MSGGYLNRALKAHADEIQQIYEDAVEDVMGGCNANLTVYVESPDDAAVQVTETVRCVREDDGYAGHVDHESDGGHVIWDDRAPGAKPHAPPRYRARLNPTGDGVVNRPDDDGWVALYHWERHPNPLAGAEAEAARLNGESPPWKAAALDSALAIAIEQRDEARERVAELEGREDEWSEWAGARLSERDRARRERDAFRNALEKIAHDERCQRDGRLNDFVSEALEGGR